METRRVGVSPGRQREGQRLYLERSRDPKPNLADEWRLASLQKEKEALINVNDGLSWVEGSGWREAPLELVLVMELELELSACSPSRGSLWQMLPERQAAA